MVSSISIQNMEIVNFPILPVTSVKKNKLKKFRNKRGEYFFLFIKPENEKCIYFADGYFQSFLPLMKLKKDNIIWDIIVHQNIITLFKVNKTCFSVFWLELVLVRKPWKKWELAQMVRLQSIFSIFWLGEFPPFILHESISFIVESSLFSSHFAIFWV